MNNPLQTFEPTKLPWLLPIKRAVAVSGLSRSTHLPHDQGAEAGRAEDAKLDPGADRKPASRWSRICRATAAKTIFPRAGSDRLFFMPPGAADRRRGMMCARLRLGTSVQGRSHGCLIKS